LVVSSRARQWFINGPWGLFVKPLAKHAWEGIKQKITRYLKKRKTEILAKSLVKKSSRKWLFVGLGILVAFVWFIWFLGCKIMAHVVMGKGISEWNTWWVVSLVIFIAILFTIAMIRAMPKSQTANTGSEPTKLKLPKIKLSVFWGFFKVVTYVLAVVWLCWYAIPSCTRLCNSQVEQRVERIPTEGQFRWEQPSEVMIGGRVPDKGICQALVQVDNSNIWQIVLSDNQGRIDHLTWEKSEPYGSWDEVGSPDKGNWWLEKIGRREYRGWITSIKYPGQRLRATLTLKY
jgi:hypothetical protein